MAAGRNSPPRTQPRVPSRVGGEEARTTARCPRVSASTRRPPWRVPLPRELAPRYCRHRRGDRFCIGRGSGMNSFRCLLQAVRSLASALVVSACGQPSLSVADDASALEAIDAGSWAEPPAGYNARGLTQVPVDDCRKGKQVPTTLGKQRLLRVSACVTTRDRISRRALDGALLQAGDQLLFWVGVTEPACVRVVQVQRDQLRQLWPESTPEVLWRPPAGTAHPRGAGLQPRRASGRVLRLHHRVARASR